MDGMLLVTTFDESARSGGNLIYTSFFGKMVRAGYEYTQEANHYSLLKTIEAGFSLGDLGAEDASVEPFENIWR